VGHSSPRASCPSAYLSMEVIGGALGKDTFKCFCKKA